MQDQKTMNANNASVLEKFLKVEVLLQSIWKTN